MSIAKVQSLTTFTSVANTGVILATIKNSNQYFLEVPVAGLATMRARIEAKGSLALKHWTRATTTSLPAKAKAEAKAKTSPITSLSDEVRPSHRIHIEFKAKIDKLAAAGNKAAIEAMAKRQYGRSKGAYRKLETCSGEGAELSALMTRAYLAQSEYEYAFAALKAIKAAA